MPEVLKDAKVVQLFTEDKSGWDEEILRDICNERDCELIKQVPVPLRKKDDSWLWLFDEKGRFTVKSCYRFLRGEKECPDKEFWKKLWGLNLPGKIINFLWRSCRKVLPTAVALRGKFVDISPMCSWCQINVEDDMHVLFQCCFAKEVWAMTGLTEVVQVCENDTVKSLLMRVFRYGSKLQNGRVGLLCWNLWNRRNNWVWNHMNMSSFGICSRASSMLEEWYRAMEERKQTNQQSGNDRRWCKPPVDWVKINTDGACKQRTGEMGVGCVIRDELGQFLRARNRVFQGQMQAKEIEAISLREALLWTKGWRRTKCIFECDSKQLVSAVNGEGGQSYFDIIVDDCREILKHYDEVLVQFVPRSANMVAHLLAQATYSMSGLNEWLYTAPDFIICNIDTEQAYF